MKTLTLKRIAENEDGTFGVLIDENTPFAVTLENSWLNNLPEISCIPAGMYTCKRYQAPTHGETFRVLNVPGRNYILFHTGNTKEDTKGCVLIGEEFGQLAIHSAVLSSKRGFKEFMERLQGVDEFQIIIKELVEL